MYVKILDIKKQFRLMTSSDLKIFDIYMKILDIKNQFRLMTSSV